jgi:hypothetical protein
LGLGPNLAIKLLDVSETGARLVVSEELAAGQEVEVELEALGLKNRTKMVSSICWQLKLEDGSFCVGVRFDKQLNYADWQNLALPR